MKKIVLTQGKFAKVDDFDYNFLNKWKWFAHKAGNKYYASRNIDKKTIKMHSILLKTPKGMDTDHIDGDSLNNQRKNLRICTRSQNAFNKTKQKNNTSGFKGVSWCERDKMWRAQIDANKKVYRLGDFLTAEEAYKAYCEACIKYHGEFSNLK
jgi:hypothetical protein